MADKRAYFKLDVGYLTNPKVAEVSTESPTAVLLHIGSIGYAAQHLTDGEVPVPLLLRLTGASKKDAELLYESGLWEHLERPGHALVHDYLQHQRSAAEVKGASAAGKRAAEARWDADRNADGNADRMPDAEGDASESAMPREEREEREKESSGGSADADRATPDRLDVKRLCDHLADSIEARGVKRPGIGKGWRDSARLLLDKDGYTEQQIHWLIDRSDRDGFWRKNILSMPTLREKADRLKLEFAPTAAASGRTPGEQPDGSRVDENGIRYRPDGSVDESTLPPVEESWMRRRPSR